MEKNCRKRGESVEIKHPPEKRHKARNSSPPKDLNDDVIEHIISFLPIQEATTLSILSKRFEKSWKFSKKLCFGYWITRNHNQIQMATVIHRILHLHSAKKIKIFQLCINPFELHPLIIEWINLALSKEPKVVDLDFQLDHGHGPVSIPFEILDIKSIQVLKLSYCIVSLPPKFTNLRFLRTLVLRTMRLSSTYVATILGNCLYLEIFDITKCYNVRLLEIHASHLKFFKVLKIGECYQLDFINVDAPTLRVFHLIGKPQNIIFQGNMTELKDVMINFKLVAYVVPRHKSMKNFMLNISYVKVLTISSTLLEDLCSTFIHGKKGPKQYLWHLKELQLLMETTSFCNPYDIICFIDKCPHLERFFIDFQKFSFAESSLYWNMHDKVKFEQCDKEFPFLKLVKISSFNFKLLELQLVKFLLEKAMNLEKFALFTMKNYILRKDSPVVHNFMQHLISWKSSPRGKIGVFEYFDPQDDVIAPKHSDYWY